jgi:hypothetical protein
VNTQINAADEVLLVQKLLELEFRLEFKHTDNVTESYYSYMSRTTLYVKAAEGGHRIRFQLSPSLLDRVKRHSKIWGYKVTKYFLCYFTMFIIFSEDVQ